MLKKIFNARYAIVLIAYALLGSLLVRGHKNELVELPLITQAAILIFLVLIGLILTFKSLTNE